MKNGSFMRINRYIASTGHSSRRRADQLIEEGRVTVNGVKAVLGMSIQEGDEVRVDGHVIRLIPEDERVVLAFHKPKGITCTSDRRRRDNIMDYINYPRRVFTVGRLDRDSRGLILLTDDGMLAHRIMHSSFGHEKEYKVTVDRPFDETFLDALREGVDLGGETTLPARAWRTDEQSFHLVIAQGLNRQIRRMCEALGYEVTDLIRLRVMHITLGSQKEGALRELSPKERQELFRLLDLKNERR